MSVGDKPEGWAEPVHEALLYPATFYGAPRTIIFVVYLVAMLVITLLAMHTKLLAAGGVLVGALLIHTACAVGTRFEPHWVQILVDWWDAPKQEIEP